MTVIMAYVNSVSTTTVVQTSPAPPAPQPPPAPPPQPAPPQQQPQNVAPAAETLNLFGVGTQVNANT